MQTNQAFPDPGPIARVERGMQVVDADGESVGKVDVVRMGDPEGETAGSERRPPSDVPSMMAEAVFLDDREPDVPQPLRDRLRRSGFIKVDGPGLHHADRYLQGSHVADVNGDRVRLNVRKDQLSAEH